MLFFRGVKFSVSASLKVNHFRFFLAVLFVSMFTLKNALGWNRGVRQRHPKSEVKMWQDPRGAKDHKRFDINHVFGSATKIADGTIFQCLHAFSSWQLQGSIIFTPSRVLPRFFAMVIQVSLPNKYMFNIQVLQCFIPNHGFPAPKRFLCPNKTCFLTPPISSNVSVIGPPHCAVATAEKKGKNRAFAENPETKSGFSPRAHVVCFRTFPQSSPGFCCHMDLGSCSVHLRKQQTCKNKTITSQPDNKQRPKQQAKKRKHNKQQRTKNLRSTNERTNQRMAQLTNDRINNTTIKQSKQSK